MKDKAFKMLLILAVTSIWVAIISRVWSSSSDDEDVVLKRTVTSDTSTIKELSRYVHLKAGPVTRDPFSGETYQEEKSDTSTKVQRLLVPKAERPTVIEKDWSEGIVLTGTGSQPGGKKLAMLSIHGKANILQAGEVTGEIKLTRILEDAVELQSGKTKKIITIQKR